MTPVTEEVLAFAKLLGFKSDGCSDSPDELLWSSVMIANGNETWPLLPCDQHDLRYFIGGDLLAKAEADCELFIGIYRIALAVPNAFLSKSGRAQAKVYFDAVRSDAGVSAWNKHKQPCCPRFWG